MPHTWTHQKLFQLAQFIAIYLSVSPFSSLPISSQTQLPILKYTYVIFSISLSSTLYAIMEIIKKSIQ